MISAPIRIVLADSQRIFLDSLSIRLSNEAGMEVLDTATNADDTVNSVLSSSPDIVIMDVSLPGNSPFDCASMILSRLRDTKIIFLAGHFSNIIVDQALRLKAHGFLLKNETLDNFIDGIKQVSAGEHCFSREIREQLQFDAHQKRFFIQAQSQLSSLTPRQLEVLRHLAHGRSVKETAQVMHLSAKSVDSHKYRLMHKLGIHDRVHLARLAIREGLITA